MESGDWFSSVINTLVVIVVIVLIWRFIAWRRAAASTSTLPAGTGRAAAFKSVFGAIGTFLWWILSSIKQGIAKGASVAWKNRGKFAVPFAYLVVMHWLMFTMPGTRDFFWREWGTEWDDNRFRFIGVEVLFCGIYYMLYQTTAWARFAITAFSTLIVALSVYPHLAKQYPSWDVAGWAAEGWKQMPEVRWSSKGSSAQAATAPTSVDAWGYEVPHLDRIPFTADCGKEGGPIPCFGEVKTFSEAAEGPTEDQVITRPSSSWLCWKPPAEDVSLWVGASFDSLEKESAQADHKKSFRHHAFSGKETESIKFLIIRARECPDHASWE